MRKLQNFGSVIRFGIFGRLLFPRGAEQLILDANGLFLLAAAFFFKRFFGALLSFPAESFFFLFALLFGAESLYFRFQFQLIFCGFLGRGDFFSRHFFEEIPHGTDGLQHVVEICFEPFQNKVDAVCQDFDENFKNDLQYPADDHQRREYDGKRRDFFYRGADAVNRKAQSE